jgi:hypothetical protein
MFLGSDHLPRPRFFTPNPSVGYEGADDIAEIVWASLVSVHAYDAAVQCICDLGQM